MIQNEYVSHDPLRTLTEIEGIRSFAFDNFWGSKITRRDDGQELALTLWKDGIAIHLGYEMDAYAGRWEFRSAEASRIECGEFGPRYRIEPETIFHIIRHRHDVDKSLP